VSRIYFHQESGEDTQVSGAERAWFGCLIADIAATQLPERLYDDDEVARWREIMSSRAPAERGDDFRRLVSLELSHGYGASLFQWRGRQISNFALQLNTALAIGSRAVQLAARIHGQCEIHAYVEEPNRTAFADIIDEAVELGVFRKLPHDSPPAPEHAITGWPRVSAMLRGVVGDGKGPVVMSYSVCEQFPGYDHEREESRPWDSAIAELRARNAAGAMLEIVPDQLAEYRFGHEVTIMDLARSDRDARLEKKLGSVAPAK